jgi:hypothetical protein
MYVYFMHSEIDSDDMTEILLTTVLKPKSKPKTGIVQSVQGMCL